MPTGPALDGSGCRLPAQVFAVGFSFRKRAILRRFLPGTVVRFIDHVPRVPAGATLLLWGSAALPENLAESVRIVRVEDGFLRSVGLGADLIHPASWVIDGSGIYYDATRPSDLELLLQAGGFDAALLARAALLRQRIADSGLTKYNTGTGSWCRPADASYVILVPGQVESDASIRYGAPAENTNMGLLRAARAAEPGAYIVYKPHPDVLAGLRAAGKGEADAARWCDAIVSDVSMAALLPMVDAVHVLTSLAGFEALLRGKAVTCHGLPFYAGWGLTTDMLGVPRRSRRLSLDQLVAAALIRYPAYVSRATGLRTTPETVLDELIDLRARSGTRLPLWRKMMRHVLRLVDGVR
ncbi:MAG: beta-3-deoxy-D-manno-oct-2-ulosonic acid transferase [Herminiimonas sp.]|nr:beta-3-deoxy-D-manno-oct-2-ulosonic acid transferase [Herminiimonas sp.]